jgi:hypothetical protein
MATIYNNDKIYLTGDDVSMGVVFNNITNPEIHSSKKVYKQYLKISGVESGTLKIISSTREEKRNLEINKV